jgi:hypothetical protein
MSDVEQLADRIRKALPEVKKGTLRFWGVWFGRPYDNWHTLLRCDAAQHVLRLYFNEDEVLSVWSPRRLTVGKSTFRISQADRVRWEWFYYGRPKAASNLCFLDFVRSAAGITASTNDESFTQYVRPSRWKPAVEILSPWQPILLTRLFRRTARRL